MVKFPNFCSLTIFPRAVMHVKKYLSIFLIGLAFAITGCSSGSSSGGLDRDPIDDIDGDGIADIVDPDVDGDGIPNEEDPDIDGDGIPNGEDPDPENNDPTSPDTPSTKTCVAATILPPNDETFPGKDSELGWKLLPQGCVLPATRANAGAGVTVRAAPQRTIGDPTSATANAGNCAAKPNGNVQCFTKIKVPEGCGQFAVVYDISEVGDVLGDTDLSKGAYKQKVFHKGNNCETEPEPEPNVPCTSAKIQWPAASSNTGTEVTITWTLLPDGCGLTDEKDIEVQATAHNSGADPKQRKSDKRRVGQFKTEIRLPHSCDWDPDPSKGTNIDSSVAIQYDFSELGEALGDPAADTDTYTKKLNHQVGSGDEICEGTEPDPKPDDPVVNVSNLRSRTEPYPKLKTHINIDGTVTASSSEGGAALYKPASEITSVLISELSEPKWSATPKGHMDIYTTGRDCSLKMINIDPNEDAGNYTTRTGKPPFTHYPDWASLQAAPEVEKCKVATAQFYFAPGNFIVNWKEGVTFTINSYNP